MIILECLVVELVHILKDESLKLDSKIKECTFLGYENGEFRYMLFFKQETIENVQKLDKVKTFLNFFIDLTPISINNLHTEIN
jgi:hypothetical protein